MNSGTNRRQFLATSGVVASSLIVPFSSVATACGGHRESENEPPFKISLAEWSLNRSIFGNKISNLDFPQIAKNEFGIDAVEYVNQFFKDRANDLRYLMELKMRCDDAGVKSLLIMIDGEGDLGHPNDQERNRAVENHHQWLVAAKYLGCHSIRVNAASQGSWDDQAKFAADGLSRLSEIGSKYGLNVIVENHGGLSSNGKWLTQVIKSVGRDNCGTLPDFGNFNIGKDEDGNDEWYDRYLGVRELMPFAKAVSAKSHDFDDNGNEKNTDFGKMMKIVHDSGYRGFVGIEYEGGGLDEYSGIRATKALLQKIIAEFPST